MSAGVTEADRRRALARYYDLDVVDITYDAELYQQLAQQAGGPVLELAVGSGRLAIPLALAGHEVLGIDNDAAMLERARRTWQRARGRIAADRLTLVEGDLLAFRSEPRFALSFLAVNTFLLMDSDDSRLAVLATMRSNLRPGGIAAVELSTPSEDELAGYDGRLQLEWLRLDDEAGDQVSKSISARHDPETDTIALTQIYEATPSSGGPLRRFAKTDVLHLLPAERLGELASEAGFSDVQLRGDHLPTPYGAGSHRVILVARLV